MKHTAATLVAIWALAALLAGCETIKNKQQANELETSVKTYVKAIRWGDYTAASAYVKHRDGRPSAIDPEKIAKIRVVEYDYSVIASDPEAKEAQMIADFKYYQADSVSVHSLSQHATWWFDAKTNLWYIDAPLPEFEK